MKLILPIILCAFGFFFAGFGYLFKLMHWPGGIYVLLGGGLVLLIGLIVLVVILNKDDGQDRD